MKKILFMLFIMVAIVSNKSKAQMHYYASVEGGGLNGVGMVGGTGTISYGNKLEWGFTTGLRSYFNAVTDIYGYSSGDGNFIKDGQFPSSKESTILMVPLILSATYNFDIFKLKDKFGITPFLSVNGGYGIEVMPSATVKSNYYTVGGEGGVRYKDFKVSIFFENQGYNYDIFKYYVYNGVPLYPNHSLGNGHLNTLGAKVTYCFSGKKNSSKTE